MCFSASASFAAGAVLSTAGLITLKKVQKPSQFLFSGIPLLFAIQQFAEGFVWLSLTNNNYDTWREPSVYTFLFFAQIVWPVMVPLSIYMLEENKTTKKILLLITGLGLMLSAFLAFCLLKYTVKAEITSHHIDYTLNFPYAMHWVGHISYFVPTVISPFVSSIKKIKLLGLALLSTYFITIMFFSGFLISVWCYFAAIISIVIYYILSDSKNRKFKNTLSYLNR